MVTGPSCTGCCSPQTHCVHRGDRGVFHPCWLLWRLCGCGFCTIFTSYLIYVLAFVYPSDGIINPLTPPKQSPPPTPPSPFLSPGPLGAQRSAHSSQANPVTLNSIQQGTSSSTNLTPTQSQSYRYIKM